MRGAEAARVENLGKETFAVRHTYRGSCTACNGRLGETVELSREGVRGGYILGQLLLVLIGTPAQLRHGHAVVTLLR